MPPKFKTPDSLKPAGERFRLFRQSILKTQSELAEEMDSHQALITSYERGIRFPPTDLLILMSNKYGLSIDWLLLGQGEMLMVKKLEEIRSLKLSKIEEILENLGTGTDVLNDMYKRSKEQLKDIK